MRKSCGAHFSVVFPLLPIRHPLCIYIFFMRKMYLYLYGKKASHLWIETEKYKKKSVCGIRRKKSVYVTFWVTRVHAQEIKSKRERKEKYREAQKKIITIKCIKISTPWLYLHHKLFCDEFVRIECSAQ